MVITFVPRTPTGASHFDPPYATGYIAGTGPESSKGRKVALESLMPIPKCGRGKGSGGSSLRKIKF